MGRKETFQLKVVSEEKVLYYGDCEVLFVPSQQGELAILPEHTPLIMKLGSGDVRIRVDGGKQTVSTAKTGILYVAENEVSVLVDV